MSQNRDKVAAMLMARIAAIAGPVPDFSGDEEATLGIVPSGISVWFMLSSAVELG